MPAVARGRLVDHEHLQAGTVRHVFADVQRVAVAQARAVHQRAVAPDGRCAIHDVVAAVAIGVRHRQPVGALAGGTLVGRDVAVEHPALRQLSAAPIPGRHHGARVVAAREDRARARTIKVGHAAEEAVDPVAARIAPGRDVAAWRRVRAAGQRCPGTAVEHGQELGAFQDKAILVAVVGVGVADHLARAVHGAVGRLGHQLGAPVAVEVEGQVGRVVRAGADVAPQVDAPHERAVEPVGVDQGRPGMAAVGIVVRIGRLPLDQQFVGAIAIEISGRAVVDHIAKWRAVGLHATRGLTQGNGLERLGPGGDGARAVVALGPPHHRAHAVGRAGGAAGVDEIGGGERRRVHAHAVAVQVEGGGRVVGAERAPADEIAGLGMDRDDAAIERLALPPWGGAGGAGQCQQTEGCAALQQIEVG